MTFSNYFVQVFNKWNWRGRTFFACQSLKIVNKKCEMHSWCWSILGSNESLDHWWLRSPKVAVFQSILCLMLQISFLIMMGPLLYYMSVLWVLSCVMCPLLSHHHLLEDSTHHEVVVHSVSAFSSLSLFLLLSSSDMRNSKFNKGMCYCFRHIIFKI